MRTFELPEQNDRIVPFADGPGFQAVTVKRDFVEPLPVGTIIACAFRITGYGQDCDGSALAEIEQIDRNGEATGWTENCIGLWPDVDVVLDSPDELHATALEGE